MRNQPDSDRPTSRQPDREMNDLRALLFLPPAYFDSDSDSDTNTNADCTWNQRLFWRILHVWSFGMLAMILSSAGEIQAVFVDDPTTGLFVHAAFVMARLSLLATLIHTVVQLLLFSPRHTVHMTVITVLCITKLALLVWDGVTVVAHVVCIVALPLLYERPPMFAVAVLFVYIIYAATSLVCFFDERPPPPFPTTLAPHSPPLPSTADHAALTYTLVSRRRPRRLGTRRASHSSHQQRADPVASASECGVCLFAVEVGDRVASLACTHTYHDECINAWLRVNWSCPVCRARVSSTSPAQRLGCREQRRTG